MDAGDGPVEIDNYPCERAIRPAAVGKKNWLFFGEAEARERSAIVHTMMEGCRRRGIDPHACLRDGLKRLPSMTNWQIKNVTPEPWGTVRRSGKGRLNGGREASSQDVRRAPFTIRLNVLEKT